VASHANNSPSARFSFSYEPDTLALAAARPRAHSVLANFGNHEGAGGTLSGAPSRAVIFGVRPFMAAPFELCRAVAANPGSNSWREGRLNRLNRRRLNDE
jgi:hypothetical protein